MSPHTFWIVVAASLALIWPLKIFRWPLGLAVVLWSYIYMTKGGVVGALLLTVPALFLFMFLNRRIREYRELSADFALVERTFGKNKPK